MSEFVVQRNVEDQFKTCAKLRHGPRLCDKNGDRRCVEQVLSRESELWTKWLKKDRSCVAVFRGASVPALFQSVGPNLGPGLIGWDAESRSKNAQ